MTPEQIQWIEALRSGRYEQGTIYLEQDNKFCCLGVACDLFAKETRTIDEGLVKYAREAETAPAKVVKILRLRNQFGHIENFDKDLTDMNDGGKTFNEIADFIVSNPDRVFLNEKQP